MGHQHQMMKAYIEDVAAKAEKLHRVFENDAYFENHHRICECGADKGVEAIFAAGDGMLTISNVKRLLGYEHAEDLEDTEAIAILMYTLAKYPPEPCDTGCPHLKEWAVI